MESEEDKVMEHAARVLNWMGNDLGLDETGRSDVIMCLMAHDCGIHYRKKGFALDDMLARYITAFNNKLEAYGSGGAT